MGEVFNYPNGATVLFGGDDARMECDEGAARCFSREWDQLLADWVWPMKPADIRKACVGIWAQRYAAKCRGGA